MSYLLRGNLFEALLRRETVSNILAVLDSQKALLPARAVHRSCKIATEVVTKRSSLLARIKAAEDESGRCTSAVIDAQWAVWNAPIESGEDVEALEDILEDWAEYMGDSDIEPLSADLARRVKAYHREVPCDLLIHDHITDRAAPQESTVDLERAVYGESTV